MKRNIARATLVILPFAVLLASVAPAAHADACSNASVAGDWAYTYTGTLFTPNGPVPLASVGHFRLDRSGNLSGSQVRSVAGSSGTEEIAGAVSVNSDCTASSTISVYVNGQLLRTGNIPFVFDNNRNHTRAIFQSLTLSDGTNVPVVITVEGNRISSND